MKTVDSEVIREMLSILRASSDPSAVWLLWSDEAEAHERSLIARCDRLGRAATLGDALRGGRKLMTTSEAIGWLEEMDDDRPR